MTVTTLAMFPGQGSQYVGMGKAILSEFNYASEIFEEAEDILKIGLRSLCLDGDEATLTLTANAQPCILTMSYALWRVIEKETGLRPDFYAGHSLGEYTALVASGKLSFDQAVKLVRIRGESMQKAVPEGLGAMAAVLRFPSLEDLEALCKKINRSGHIVEIANYNSPKQVVVAGHSAAIDELIETLKNGKERVIAKKLRVSAPFHCSLMTPVVDMMAPHLKAATFRQNDAILFANISAEGVKDYHSQFLSEQISHSVRWTQTITNLKNLGCQRYIEIGPKRVLCGLVEDTIGKDDFQIISCDDYKEAIPVLLHTHQRPS